MLINNDLEPSSIHASFSSSGASISYTMGSMTISGFTNKTDNTAGTSGTNNSSSGMTVSFSF